MSIDFPAAGKKAVLAVMADEALHVHQGIAKEKTDLVGEAGGVHQAVAQVMQRCADGEGRVAQGQQKTLDGWVNKNKRELLWPEEVEQLFLCLCKHHKPQAGELVTQMGQLV